MNNGDSEGLTRFELGMKDHRVVVAVAAGLGYRPHEIIHFHAGNPLAIQCEGGWEADVHLDVCGRYHHGHATVSDPTEVGRKMAVQQAVTAAFDTVRPVSPDSSF